QGGRGAAGYAAQTLNDRNLRGAIAALSLVGAGIAAYLSYTRLAHTQILCTSGGCETVKRSRYSKLAGLPVAYLGVATYPVLLAAFCAVVERKSFSQAAERLGVTQPAVSLQIRSLEERLGQRLLDRSGRRVEPTEAGLVLYRGAQRLLALEEQIIEQVAAGDAG